MTQRIAVGLTLLAALFATACGDDPKPQPAEATLVFRTQPGSVRAGERLGAVEVALVDANGNVVVERGGTVQLTLTDAPADARLGGSTRTALLYGVARFTDLTVAKVGANMKLSAQVGTQTASSSAFSVRAAAPARMALTTGPTDVDVHTVLSPVVINVQDAFGNTADDAATVTVALEGGATGATLGGNTTAEAVNGVATFNELTVDEDGTGYVLAFSSGSLPVVKSAPFTVRPGQPASLSFTTQPAESAVAGATLAPVRVTVLDSHGRVAKRAQGNVTVELVSGNGATLAGTASVAVANGVATFDALSVQKAGAGYTLRASFGSLTAADSSAFAITPAAAARLAYVAAPGAATAGVAFSPAVQVELLDTYGNRTASNATVAVALDANPGSATLNGTASVSAEGGVATFANLSINVAAQGYTLRATSGLLESATSGTFDIAPAAAAALAFTAQPANGTAGAALAPAVEVTIRDAFGNTVPSTEQVTLALQGGAGVVLNGTTTVAAENGVARFSAVNVQRAGAGYTLRASSGSLAEATSSAFSISAADAAKLVISQQPANGTAGVALNPGMRVSILDAFDNQTASTASVTVALAANPANGTLLGTLTVSADAGVATFGALRLEKAGSGYSLRATSDGLTEVTSNTFDIAAASAAALAFRTQPANGIAGQDLAAFEVEVHDAYGNMADSTATITLALGANPGGDTLGGDVEEAAAAGVARFSAVHLRKAAADYTLRATSDGLTEATSSAFSISAADAAKLAVSQQPANGTAGVALAPGVRVSILDAFDNQTASTASVTVALAANPANGTLLGTLTVSADAGVATFDTLRLEKAGSGYSLRATSDGLTEVTSNTFDISAASAAKLVISQQPANGTAGVALTPGVRVSILDAFDNQTASTASVTVALAANPANGTLLGTLTVSADAGVATFGALRLEKAGSGYSLRATSDGLSEVTSNTFNIAPAGVDTLVVATEPPETAVAGESLGTITVEARDAFGNLVPSYGELVAVAVDPDANPAGASVVAGAREVAAVNGVVTFEGLALDKVGATQLVFVGYNAAFTELYVGYSRAVNITAAAASAMAFRPVAAETQAGSAIGPAVQVQVTDRFGNATSGSGNVTLSLGANPGGDTLRGTLTQPVSNGVATFADLVLEKAGRGYTLKASQTGLTPATSAPFAIIGAEPTRLEFAAQPRSTPNGLPLNEVAVRLVDAFGNTATSASEVALALGNANGAVLGGTVQVAAQAGVARFGDLTVDRNGQGYTLAASSGPLVGAESAAFDVYGATLAYTDPAAGRIRVMRNPSSTATRLVLDVVAAEDLSGYGVGFNLPLDATKVRLPTAGALTAGAILSAGASVPAAAVALPASGPLAGVLTSGISQKAGGSGSVAADTAIPTGSVLYQLTLELAPGAEPGVVFDGASLGSRFKGLLRNKLGDDVVGSNDFGIGRLEITADPGFQQTAQR
ncbi:hypothetical protein [Myxococcus sp. RHSTA-1-4]|uniref:beta strand repeat-containing protein n=1 Tax=Myxococcus sp. RHSTA-1-4 TaxID=2874601 RepID=UPI001CBBE144|nr:hypothetical protein [Myxococcus sp. RHSTA-1-4]MBZ4420766.1 hypothetical protein [Myxococcus sp. RHSTA-1-4]